MKTLSRFLAALVLAAAAPLAVLAADPAAPKALPEGATKLKAKGALVMPVAANDDSLVVNLSLMGKAAKDEDLALVKGLPKVVELNLANTSITDAGLANVAGLTSLTHLHLEKTAVTDAGLAHVKGLTNLVYLNLYETAVTDAGLEHVKGLKNLKRLFLWQTKVTDAGAKGLKAANAGLTINRGEETAALMAVKPAEVKPAVANAAVKPAPAGAKPVNKTCPVSGKPVDPTKPILAFDGKNVGFCCDNCPKSFEKEPEKFKAKIVADAAPAKPAEAPKPAPAVAAPAKPAEPAKPADPAKPALAAINAKCPVSDKDVDPTKVLLFAGKSFGVGFCCDNCPKAFEKDPAKYLAKITPAAAPKAAAPAAPAKIVNTKCPRTGNPVNAALTAVHDGKTIGFCSEECQGKFKADASKYLPRLVEDVK